MYLFESSHLATTWNRLAHPNARGCGPWHDSWINGTRGYQEASHWHLVASSGVRCMKHIEKAKKHPQKLIFDGVGDMIRSNKNISSISHQYHSIYLAMIYLQYKFFMYLARSAGLLPCAIRFQVSSSLASTGAGGQLGPFHGVTVYPGVVQDPGDPYRESRSRAFFIILLVILIYIYITIYIYISIYIIIYICVHIYIYVCVCPYGHIYCVCVSIIYIYIHTYSTFCPFFLATQSSPQSSHLWALGLRCLRVTPAGSSLQRWSQRSGRRCPLPRAAWLDVHSTASTAFPGPGRMCSYWHSNPAAKMANGYHISQRFRKLTGKPVCGLETQ